MTTTLRLRLTRYFAGVLVGVLLAFAGTVWAIIAVEEASEPPQVAALEPPEHQGRNVLLALAAAIVVAVPLAVAGAATIARRGLASLDDVVATAKQVSSERLDARVPLRADAPTEVGELVTSMNAMLERLDRSVAGMRRFTADASHELRTPLAALMTELEVTLRQPRNTEALCDTIGGALESLQDMTRLVEALLAQAQADAGSLPIASRTLELAATVKRAVEPYDPMATLRYELDEVTAHADPLWIARIVANLVDNAVKHVPADGEIRVRVQRKDGRPQVEVENDGPAVPAGDRERIFERFYRGEAARASGRGFGLGLSLAREIARALGGELTLRDASPTCFVLTLRA